MRMLSRRSASAALTGTIATATFSTMAFQAAKAAFLPGSITLYNVNAFGAIGNGSSNPASDFFSSLSALRTKYAFATALTNEMDWLATQEAINAANAAGGGIVYSPSGRYVYCNTSSTADGSGTLTFPLAASINPTGGVSWQGDFPNSVHSWPCDLGTGRFAVLCAGRSNSSSVGFFTGLCLIGPGCGSKLGTSTCGLQGIGTNDRRQITNVHVSGFRCAINVVGGQFMHSDLYLFANYYGYYFDMPNTANFGNMQFSRCVVDNSLLAAVGVHHAVTVGNSIFISCAFDATPYSLYKETNSGTPTQPFIISGAVFDSCQFENFGNAVIADDTASTSTRVVQVYNSKFKNCQYMWDTYGGLDFQIAARGSYCVFDVYSIVDTEIDGIWQPEQLQPGTKGIFAAQNVGGLRLRGDMTAVTQNCINAVSPKVNTFFYEWGPSGTRIEHTGYQAWSGTIGFTRGSLPVGSIAVQALGQGGVNASAGTNADTVLGIVMYNPAPAGAYVQCIYADSAEDGVTVNVSGTVTIGQYMRTSSGGNAVAASGANDTTSPIFGIALSASSGGTCLVKLKGLS